MIEKANALATFAYIKADMAKDRVKNELSELAHQEMGVSGIVVSLILIGIAAVLAIVFRDNIKDFMDSVFDTADKTLKDLEE